MLLQELTEARVEPDAKFMSAMERAIDRVIKTYGQYLDDNNDLDDIDYLAELLNRATAKLPVEFEVIDDERQDPNEWISAEAGVDDDGEFMTMYLFSDNLEGKYGPKTFKNLLMQAMKHEAIHWNQYGKIGHKKLGKIKSGHQKGQEKMAKSGDPMDWMREYLADPHELMAYASDLATEIKQLDNPEQVLRNPEAHKADLPSYQRYRQVFEPNSKEMRQLLKYTADYYSNSI
jgi:hypothetical protein